MEGLAALMGQYGHQHYEKNELIISANRRSGACSFCRFLSHHWADEKSSEPIHIRATGSEVSSQLI